MAFGPLNLKLPMDEVQHRVEEAFLKRVGMEGFEEKSTTSFKRQAKKRIAIAGILAMKPEIMILDEPTAGFGSSGALKNHEFITLSLTKKELQLYFNT